VCDLFPGKFVSNYKSRTGVSYPAIIDRREGRGKKGGGTTMGGRVALLFLPRGGLTITQKKKNTKYLNIYISHKLLVWVPDEVTSQDRRRLN
jgi:hypothetical protein